ncbi:hypothetical protein Scep_018228 [Stephania cephalantha]|uniref:Protein LAZY 1 n=1 Tax=Stephania cephalantha TaxID=152367 RepID=A0AAP0IS06_9MAGN
MKLLGWMHRKFRQNSNEPLKDFAIGNACNCLLGQPSMDEHQFYPNNNNNNKPSNYPNYTRVPAQKHHPHNYQPHNSTKESLSLRKSFTGLDQDDLFEAHSAEELFDGLLAIGTLGGGGDNALAHELEPPGTPTLFPPHVSLDHVVTTEKEAEVTESDLKLINEELEKVLGADAKDVNDKFNDIASGRTSHVSSITLSGRDSNAVCPLQGYLFGSPIELPETLTGPAATNVVGAGAGAGKKEHRTSLGELFQRTKMAEDHDKREMGEKNNVKKILKKRMMLRSSTNGSVLAAPPSSATTDPVVSADTKFNKILQMFHRKVHPETAPCTKKDNAIGGVVVGPNYDKAHKNENKSNDGGDYGLILGPVHDEDIVIFPKGPICKQQRVRRYKCHANSASFAIGDGDSNGNREHWIKTDADYLVLEL